MINKYELLSGHGKLGCIVYDLRNMEAYTAQRVHICNWDKSQPRVAELLLRPYL